MRILNNNAKEIIKKEIEGGLHICPSKEKEIEDDDLGLELKRLDEEDGEDIFSCEEDEDEIDEEYIEDLDYLFTDTVNFNCCPYDATEDNVRFTFQKKINFNTGRMNFDYAMKFLNSMSKVLERISANKSIRVNKDDLMSSGYSFKISTDNFYHFYEISKSDNVVEYGLIDQKQRDYLVKVMEETKLSKLKLFALLYYSEYRLSDIHYIFKNKKEIVSLLDRILEDETRAVIISRDKKVRKELIYLFERVRVIKTEILNLTLAY